MLLGGTEKDFSPFKSVSICVFPDNISIAPAQKIQSYLKESESIIGGIDPNDIPSPLVITDNRSSTHH
jgi:predicted nucleic acid-binding protein